MDAHLGFTDETFRPIPARFERIIPTDEEFDATIDPDSVGTERVNLLDEMDKEMGIYRGAGKHVDNLRALDTPYRRAVSFSPRRVFRNILKNVSIEAGISERAAAAYATNCTMSQLNSLDQVL